MKEIKRLFSGIYTNCIQTKTNEIVDMMKRGIRFGGYQINRGCSCEEFEEQSEED